MATPFLGLEAGEELTSWILSDLAVGLELPKVGDSASGKNIAGGVGFWSISLLVGPLWSRGQSVDGGGV